MIRELSGLKFCSTCRIFLKPEEFSPKARYFCRSCEAIRQRERYRTNEKHRVYAKSLVKKQTESGYSLWKCMLNRCHRESTVSYKYYGARGISVCQEWRNSFAAFSSYVGIRPSKKHTLDRINNEGNYEPGNVRWATWPEQMANKRKRKGRRQ